MKSGYGEFSCKIKRKSRPPLVDTAAPFRKCLRCGKLKEAVFFPKKRDVGYTRCFQCADELKEADRKKKKIRDALVLRRLKIDVAEKFGSICRCCGEAHPEFLVLDHAFGRKHEIYTRDNELLKKLGSLWKLVKKLRYPQDRYRLLCANCNSSLGFFGYCPHGESQERPLRQFGVEPRRNFKDIAALKKGRKEKKRI